MPGMGSLRDTALLRSGLGEPPGSFVTAAGVPVHYVLRGASRPVIYVHGAKGSVYDLLLSIGDEVSGRYTAVAFDRPGSGFSGRLDEADGGTPQVQAAVLRRAAQELGLERPVLVGHSFGAAVCLAWAFDAPEDVAAVVTLSGHVLPLGEAPPRVAALARSRVTLRAMALLAHTSFGKSLVERVLRRIFFPDPVPDEYLRIAPAMALDPERLVNDGEERASWTRGLRALEREYPRLRTPVIIVVGEQDQVVPPASSLRLHRLLPNAELRVIAGAGHLPQFAHPGDVMAAIDRAAAMASVAEAAGLEAR